MKRLSQIVLLLLPALLAGCALQEMMFDVLEPFYSAGGVDRESKRQHFHDSMSAAGAKP